MLIQMTEKCNGLAMAVSFVLCGRVGHQNTAIIMYSITVLISVNLFTYNETHMLKTGILCYSIFKKRTPPLHLFNVRVD